MPITGGIKFFEKSKSLKIDGSSIVVSTGSGSKDFAIDRNMFTVWKSVGSNDVTTETLTITFPTAITIDRILLLSHNFKGFNIQYDVAAVWTHFAGVIGLDGALANITETAFADATAYYEFTPVTTTKVRVEITTTQIANAEKFLSQFIATEELGTLLGFPRIESVRLNRNLRVSDMGSGRKSISKSLEAQGFTLSMDPYPASYDVDLNLLYQLNDLEVPFLIWPCGGKRGTTNFRFTLRGFRLQDCVPVQLAESIQHSYVNNLYVGPISTSFVFEEVSL